MKNMKKQEKFNLITFIIAISITCIFMFVFIDQKKGWHEDEIFSYGSSNYKYDNLFLRYGTKDSLNTVHLASSFSLNHFSKYIIFAINLLFYIGSCFAIRKIMKLFNKDNLSGITVLLYGLSMGAISIVMFQRMYMMLTFFILIYLYLNLKVAKNSYEIDILKENEGLKDQTEFILNIKCWLPDVDSILADVLEYTGATSHELLLDDGQSRVYKVQK